jgi:acid ceramidase
MLSVFLLLSLVGAAQSFDLPCNICWAVLNEVEGLLAENVTQSNIKLFLETDLCRRLPAGAPVVVCDALANFGVPLLVNTLLATEHVGAACQQLKQCALPEPMHKDLWQVPTFVLDLDLPPSQRWTALFAQHANMKADVVALVNVVRMLLPTFAKADMQLLGQALLARLDAEYQGEVQSIASAVGVPVGYIAVAQLAYELSDCTSIVANVGASDVMHFRNLDFGAGLGFTDTLRDLLVHVLVQRNGTTLAHVQTFAGYIGVLTGMRPGAFSITINTRFLSKNPFVVWERIIDQILTHPTAFMPAHLVRRTLLTPGATFATAAATLSSTPILGAVYFTIGGLNANEGRILARGQSALAHTVAVGSQPGAQWPYVLQTNYDWWNHTVPWIDDRQDAGVNAMNALGQANVNLFSVINNVLSLRPTFNQLSVVSVAMHTKTADFVVLGRYCNAPCPF